MISPPTAGRAVGGSVRAPEIVEDINLEPSLHPQTRWGFGRSRPRATQRDRERRREWHRKDTERQRERRREWYRKTERHIERWRETQTDRDRHTETHRDTQRHTDGKGRDTVCQGRVYAQAPPATKRAPQRAQRSARASSRCGPRFAWRGHHSALGRRRRSKPPRKVLSWGS
jgi:hypothetical protein